jgi:malonate transporter and related proteins
MASTLAVILPVFIVMLAGWASVRTGILADRVTDSLSDFVFVVAVPVLLFRSLATSPLPETLPFGYWGAYFGALAISWAVAQMLCRRVLGLPALDSTLMGFAAAQSNTVFVGIPVILRAFGEEASVPIFLLIAVHLPLTVTVASVLIQRSASTGGGNDVFKALVRHPILIGIVAGALWRVSGLPLPEVGNAALRLVGDAAAPCALFALGMTLNRYGLAARPMMLAAAASLKLMVQPALVWLLAFHVFPMPKLWAATAVLFACCPTGVNAYLLAQRYRAAVGPVAGMVSVTTVASAITMAFWVFVVTR